MPKHKEKKEAAFDAYVKDLFIIKKNFFRMKIKKIY